MTAAVEASKYTADYMRIPLTTAAADAGVPEKIFSDPAREKAYWMAQSIALNVAAQRETGLHAANPLNKDATVFDPKVGKLLDGHDDTLHTATELLVTHHASVNEAMAATDSIPDVSPRGAQVGRQIVELFSKPR